MEQISQNDSEGNYWKRIFTVLTGTAIAQIFPLMAMPFITRLFGPSEMGEFNIVIGASSIMMILGTARLELALFVSKTDEDYQDLIRLIFVIAVLVSALTALACLLFRMLPISSRFSTLSRYGFELALILLLTAINQTAIGTLVFKRRFTELGWFRIALAGSVSILQILAGVLRLGIRGLLWSQIIATAVSMLLALLLFRVWDRLFCSKWDFARLLACFKVYKSFPLYSVPADFINTLTSQLPVFLLAGRFGTQVSGYYGLTTKALSAPIGLLASSVLDVYKEQAAREYQANNNCRSAFIKTFRVLGMASFIPFLLLFFVSPWAFSIIFGAQWKESGLYARTLIPLFYIRFIVSPLSYTIYIAQKQKYDLVWQIFLCIFVFLSFFLTKSMSGALVAYSAVYSIMYLIYLYVSLKCAYGVMS